MLQVLRDGTSQLPWILLALLFATSQVGCVRRRMTIRSDPPGAVVFVDERRIGVTPVSTNFTYYGTRNVQLVKDGHETAKRSIGSPLPGTNIPWSTSSRRTFGRSKSGATSGCWISSCHLSKPLHRPK